jgi:CheY-like chemotaxis protein
MSRALRVLVVDDEDAVEVAGDGEQAMERLSRARFEPGGPPQLVLLDLKMPRMGGLEALGRIRAGEATKRLPVVVLTTSERPEDREEALRLGATCDAGFGRRCGQRRGARHRRGRGRFAASVSA